jgi:zinc transporter 9
VLVGTSLIVIIPEGIETMYSAVGQSHTHVSQKAIQKAIQPTIPSVAGLRNSVRQPAEIHSWKRSEATESAFSAVKAAIPDMIGDKLPIEMQVKKTKDGKEKTKEKGKDHVDELHPQKGGDDDSTEGHKEGHTRVHAPQDAEHHITIEHEEGSSPHAFIGVALILGYILMFLVDHVPDTIASSKPKYQPMHISLSNLHRGPHNASSLSLNGMASEAVTPLATPMPLHMTPKKTSSTTIGLIVHACADGIALGASSTAPSTSLSLVIFFAIMLHKAPAAFGLTSVLLKQGLSKKTARTHLAFFSLAAPVGALATWAIVHTFGRGRLGGDEGLTWSTGWVLCFSGGTFL